MIKANLLNKNCALIGEEISHELGAQMIKDYQVANPTDVHVYTIGRNIIDQILAQPGCVAIKFYNAYDEMGEKTLVYVGLDENGKALLQYTSVNSIGELISEKGIVADRINKETLDGFDYDNWTWIIE